MKECHHHSILSGPSGAEMGLRADVSISTSSFICQF